MHLSFSFMKVLDLNSLMSPQTAVSLKRFNFKGKSSNSLDN